MRRRIQGLVRFAFAALLAIGFVELIARRFQYRPVEIDAVFGRIYEPGKAVRWATEGDAVSHWRPRGVRGERSPDPARPRILVLGDSFTEALQVADDEVYTQRMQLRLESRGFSQAVMNVGKSGASVAHYLSLAGEYLDTFSPVWVVIQIRDDDLGSDTFDRPDVRVRRAEGGGFDVELRQARSGALSERLLRPLGRLFALPNFLMTRLGEHRSAWAAEPPLFAAGSAPRAVAEMPGEAIDAHPVAELLDALHRAYAERVTLFYVPSFDPQRPSEPATRTEGFVAERCQERGWSCVSLRSAYPEFARRRDAPFGFPNTNWNQGHLNSAGHAAAGDLLADEMARLAGRDLL